MKSLEIFIAGILLSSLYLLYLIFDSFIIVGTMQVCLIMVESALIIFPCVIVPKFKGSEIIEFIIRTIVLILGNTFIANRFYGEDYAPQTIALNGLMFFFISVLILDCEKHEKV